MTDNNRKFQLPPKVDSYLAILNRLYERQKKTLLQEIVVNGTVSVHEGWDYDNWNGGTYGHAITLTVPEDIYLRVMEADKDVRNQINTDLNKLHNEQNENFSVVFIEMETKPDEKWREKSGVYRPRMAASSIPGEDLRRIWGNLHIRVFLSHKSSVKKDTSKLKQSLSKFGIAAFVAHEDIEPTEEWMREIERALFSMDALVALLSDNYHESNWTDQEVGVAIGRGVPLISIRLGMDPYGLMGKGQGLGGCIWSDTDDMASKIFHILVKKLSDKSRLFQSALSVYARSRGFEESAWNIKHLLSIFETLTAEQVDQLIKAYQSNPKNKCSFSGMDLLKPLFEKWTHKDWTIKDNELVLAKKPVQSEDEIPF
jgi:hypothetical protein